MPLISVDLLEELRAALDELEPLLGGRIVDIELSRFRVLADPVVFRLEIVSLIESAVADAEPTHSITVRVAMILSKAKGEKVVGARLPATFAKLVQDATVNAARSPQNFGCLRSATARRFPFIASLRR